MSPLSKKARRAAKQESLVVKRNTILAGIDAAITGAYDIVKPKERIDELMDIDAAIDNAEAETRKKISEQAWNKGALAEGAVMLAGSAVMMATIAGSLAFFPALVTLGSSMLFAFAGLITLATAMKLTETKVTKRTANLLTQQAQGFFSKLEKQKSKINNRVSQTIDNRATLLAFVAIPEAEQASTLAIPGIREQFVKALIKAVRETNIPSAQKPATGNSTPTF